MKKYRFLTPAILEVEAASQFYESNRPELGREFLDELDATIQRIVANPILYPSKISHTNSQMLI